jgi:PPOX class probable F420-dependent enzyme
MRLDPDECRRRIGSSGHGVLGTVHAERGVDAVPVVFVVGAGEVVIPIDTVKPKSGAPLQRLANLAADDRCVLLVDRYDDDWSKLWWVRVHGRGHETLPTREQRDALARAFPAYGPRDAVARVVVVTIDGLHGWSAEADPG